MPFSSIVLFSFLWDVILYSIFLILYVIDNDIAINDNKTIDDVNQKLLNSNPKLLIQSAYYALTAFLLLTLTSAVVLKLGESKIKSV